MLRSPTWIDCHNAFWHCFLCEAYILNLAKIHFLRRQHSHPAYLLEQQECTYDALNSQLTRLWNRAINSQDCKPVFFFTFFLCFSLSF